MDGCLPPGNQRDVKLMYPPVTSSSEHMITMVDSGLKCMCAGLTKFKRSSNVPFLTNSQRSRLNQDGTHVDDCSSVRRC